MKLILLALTILFIAAIYPIQFHDWKYTYMNTQDNCESAVNQHGSLLEVLMTKAPCTIVESISDDEVLVVFCSIGRRSNYKIFTKTLTKCQSFIKDKKKIK